MSTLPPRSQRPTAEPLLSAEELTRLADTVEMTASQLPLAYSKPGPDLRHLSVTLTQVRDLLDVLADANNRLHTHLAATTAPAPHLAHTASDLSYALGATGRAVNYLAAAQSAQLFIDHTPDMYGNSDVDCDFARARITNHLTTAREALTEASTLLRTQAGRAEPGAERLHAARARSPHTLATATAPPAAPSTQAPPAGTPSRAKGR
jgi:hypothetical protein